MKVDVSSPKNSQVTITISTDVEVIKDARKEVLRDLRPQVKAEGFRDGHAPDAIVEKKLGTEYVQNLVIERAIGRAYAMAAAEKDLKTLGQPEVELKKFIPYETLEFEAKVEVAPEFKLPDYKNLKVDVSAQEITDKDVDEVIENLRTRTAETKEVDRAAKDGDKAWIDFKGVRADNNEEISGATGEDYPLLLGSNTFIKGFEPEIVGMKPKEDKEFTVTFPKDYHVASLKGEKVKFNVTVKKVEEVSKPKVDDEFAKKAGPFKGLDELKKDIRKQLEQEAEQRHQQDVRQSLVNSLVDKAKFDIPPKMLDRVKTQLKQEFERDLQHRGLTLAQYCEREGVSEEEFEKGELTEKAQRRAKASLLLTEVAEAEKLTVNPEELEIRMQMIKQQYSDPQLQAELEKPEARRELIAQMLTEKTISKLAEYNS